MIFQEESIKEFEKKKTIL